jgi:hypothetical protein
LTDWPGLSVGRDERLGAATLVTAPVRELVRVHPARLTVQLLVATNLAVPVVPGARLTAVGLAVIFGFGVEHAVANSGRASVGAVPLPEHASAAGSSREAIVTVRINGSLRTDFGGETKSEPEGTAWYWKRQFRVITSSVHLAA